MNKPFLVTLLVSFAMGPSEPHFWVKVLEAIAWGVAAYCAITYLKEGK